MITDNLMRQKLIDALSCLEEYQGAISEQAPNWNGDHIEHASTAILGLQVEVGELFNALRIKPWRADHLGPRDAMERLHAADEFADVLAFIGYLMHCITQVGITPGDIARAYIGKSKVNRSRFAAHVNSFDSCNGTEVSNLTASERAEYLGGYVGRD